jgi:hypothetical protein
MKREDININICGDFYISPDLINGDYFDEDILAIFNNSDLNVVNLEGPLIGDKADKIAKAGPHLNICPDSVFLLKQIRADLLTLANNHIMDYGVQGLINTFSVCDGNSISHVGAGMSLEEAQDPFIIEKENIKIAILNFAEHEWSIADKNRAGANPLNLVENIRQIKKAKEISDFVIVIIHGGHERYHLPSPRMVSQYRFFAENGASVIIGHHTHCISGYEVYNDVPIFYSLGNFLFTMKSDFESAYTGLVLNLKVKPNEKIKWDIIPVKQDRETYTLTIINGDARRDVLSEVERYADIIADEAILSRNWDNFISENLNFVLDVFSPIHWTNNRYLKSTLRRLGLNRFFINKNHYQEILNYIECESLLEVSTDVIQKFLATDENSNP